MNKTLYRLLCAGLLAGSAGVARAVPADPRPITVTQPDGTTLVLSHRGDEKCSFFVSESGLIVRRADDGWYRVVANDGSLSNFTPADLSVKPALQNDFEPAKAFESLQRMALNNPLARNYYGQNAVPAPARAVAPGIYDNADGHDLRKVPTTGSPHVLVILVNYTDVQFSYCPDPHTEMVNAMTQPGYSNYGATGSALDFYRDQSRGIYTPQFDVYGPVQLPHERVYYGGNGSNGSDARAYQMVIDACNILDGEVDFSKYDTNGDGYVDNVYVFYAGNGENDSNMPNCVWPHSWNIEYAETPPVLDGVKINRYACSNELNFRPSNPDPEFAGIGTFCHEFGHVLGQPDMYATSYTNSFTPGSYSAMDHGSYNNNGRTPPNFSAYERYAMEWIKPIDITEPTAISMFSLTNGGNVYKMTLDASRPTEYFLFENRQQDGWDEFIPGHGMLVWHIDFNKAVWDKNIVNNTPGHQYADIIEADGTQSEGTRDADVFPGTRTVTSFTHLTVPAFCNWDKTASKLPLTDIEETVGGIISFKAGEPGENDPFFIATPEPQLAASSASQLELAWAPVAGAEGYTVNVYSRMIDPLFGDIIVEPVEGYTMVDAGNATSLKVSGLPEETSFIVEVFARKKDNVSGCGSASFSTLASSLQNAQPALFVTPDDVTALMKWPEIEGATGYALTVGTRTEGEYATAENVSFDNKQYPLEWLLPGSFDDRQDYSGMATPSVKFDYQQANILSGIYDEDIAEIDFWARINRNVAKFKLSFYAVAENGMLTHLADVTDIPNSKNGTDVKVTGFPDGVRQWMCVFTYSSADLALNMDDIKVKTRGSVNTVALPGYDAKAVSGTAHTVSGLQRSTDYVAWLTASDAAGSSRPSQLVRFRTLAQSGIDKVTADSDAPVFVVSGGVLRTDATEPYSVYTIDGAVLALDHTGAFTLPSRGVYVVKCGGKGITIRY